MITKRRLIAFVAAMAMGSAMAAPAAAAPRAVDPNNPDLLGGRRVFDGAQAESIATSGQYAMIYLHDKVRDERYCQKMQDNNNWKKNVKRFRDDKKLNPIYKRMAGKLNPTGQEFPVFPNQTVTHITERSTTESWQQSFSMTAGVEFDFDAVKVSVSATYGRTYEKEITISQGKSVDAPNKTGNKIIYYQYGVTYDVFSLQETPWRADWRLEGEKILIGDDAKAVARWYTVPDDGCYRTALFSSLSLPSGETLAPVAQIPFITGQTTAPPLPKVCPMSIAGSEVYPYHWVEIGDDKYLLPDSYDEETEEAKSPMEEGKCLLPTANNGWHEEDGTVYYEITEQDEFGGYYFVDARDVKFNSPAAQSAKPIPGWASGTTFTLEPVTAKGLAMTVKTGGEPAALGEAKDGMAEWKVLASDVPGRWRMQNVARAEYCTETVGRGPDFEPGPLEVVNCAEDHPPQQFSLVLAGDGTFYLRSVYKPEWCYAPVKPEGGSEIYAHLCVKDRDKSKFDDPKFLWRLTPA